jgi:cytochrome c55X
MKYLLFLASCCLLNIAGSGEVIAAAGLSAARSAALENMLVQDCGSCHGLTLRGGLGPALLPENLEGKTRELLITVILEGRTGTAMPPWKTMLSEQEAAWMADRLLNGAGRGDGS